MNLLRLLGWLKRRKRYRRIFFFSALFFVGKFFFDHCLLLDVFVWGRSHTSLKDLKKCVKCSYKKPLLSINLETLHDKVKKLPWVKNLIVQRYFPHTLCLRLEERRPIALWFHKKKNYLVDEEGELLSLRYILKEFSHLFSLFGENAFKEFPKLLILLQKHPTILKRITHFTFVRKRRWNLLIDDFITVKLPDQDIEKAIIRLTHILSLDIAKIIDLRVPQRTIISPQEGEKI